MKELYFELIAVVKYNRSLAENSPMNLLRFSKAKKAYDILGHDKYLELINSILDDLEW